MKKSIFWTIPNAITLSRILLTFSLYFLAYNFHQHLFLGIFIIAGLTDVLDGTLARKFNMTSRLGASLDTIADIVFQYSMFFWLTELYPIGFFKVLHWILIAFGIIILYFTITMFVHKEFIGMHTVHNKFNSAALFVIFLGTLLFGFIEQIYIALMVSIIIANCYTVYHVIATDKIRVRE